MKLVKTVKKHLIYELNEKEKEKLNNGINFLIFKKKEYGEVKPLLTWDYGYHLKETENLEDAVEFCKGE